MSGPPILWNFGKLESVLAAINDIADSKRTAFQARLKNLHRLKFPIGFKQQMGKAALYRPYEIMMMALAVDLTQLGLSPETIVRTLSLNWYPTHLALGMSARTLSSGIHARAYSRQPDDPDDMAIAAMTPMFLFFDPVALASLMTGFADEYDPATAPDDTFFYGGIGVVRDNIGKWTAGKSSRISFVNVTALLARVVDEPFPDSERNTEYRLRFFDDVESWTLQFEADIAGTRSKFLRNWIEICLPYYAESDDEEGDIRYIHDGLGLDDRVIRETLRTMRRERASATPSRESGALQATAAAEAKQTGEPKKRRREDGDR